MNLTQQSMVNCDVPGFRRLEFSPDGVTWTAVTVAGWLPFKSYLAALTAALSAAGKSWTLTYDPSSDRVQFVPDSLEPACGFRFENLRHAWLLGFTGGQTISPTASTITSDVGPDGVVPLQSLHLADPVPTRRVDGRSFRHNRHHGVAHGSGTRYTARVRVAYADRQRLLAGPAAAGKVRVGPYDAAQVYQAGQLGGYLDAHLLHQPRAALTQGDLAGTLDVDLDLLAPTAAHNPAQALAHAVLDSANTRGGGLNYYALVDGVPVRFCELDPGLTDSARTVSPTLVVDQAQTMTTQLDRSKGVANASGLRLGVLDPLGELGIFGRAANQSQLTAQVTHTATAVEVDDGSVFAGKSHVYLGLECWAVDSISTNTINLAAGARGQLGPVFTYPVDGITKYRTVSDRKLCWHGTIVQLYAQLLDPYGYAVDTTWEGAHALQMGTFSVDGLPGYDNGVWVLECSNLIRRLTTELGAATTGTLAPSLANAAIKGEGGALLVETKAGQSLRMVATATYGSDETDITWTADIDLSDLVGVRRFSECVDSVLIAVLSSDMPSSAFGADYILSLEATIFASEAHYDIGEQGEVRIGLKIKKTDDPAAQADHLTITILPGDNPPYWWTNGVVVWPDHSTETTELLIASTGLDGRTCRAFAIDGATTGDTLTGAWPSSGYAVLTGADNTAELVRFLSTETVEGGARVVLKDVNRLLGGDSCNAFNRGANVVRAEYFTGHPGQYVAQLLEGSGTGTRGAFDTFDAGYGYGLTESQHVLATATGAQKYYSLTGCGLITAMALAMAEAASLQKQVGGTLAALGRCVAWVRDGSALRLGLVDVAPIGATALIDHTLTDADLLDVRAVSVTQVAPGPNIIDATRSSLTGDKTGDRVVYRVLEDMAARGGQTQKVSLPGIGYTQFYSLASNLAAGLVNGSISEYAIRVKVGPHRDIQAGQLVRFQLEHPGAWDYADDAPGLTALGRVLRFSRNLLSGECEMVALVQGPTPMGALCPTATITNVSGDDVTVSDPDPWTVGDTVLVYTPGQSLTAAPGSDLRTVDVKAGNVLTLSTVVGLTITTGDTQITFPADDVSTATADQLAHTHVDDGLPWLI